MLQPAWFQSVQWPKTTPFYYLENELISFRVLTHEEAPQLDDIPPSCTITNQTDHSELVIAPCRFQEAKVIRLSMELDSTAPFYLKFLPLLLVEFSEFKELFKDVVSELQLKKKYLWSWLCRGNRQDPWKYQVMIFKEELLSVSDCKKLKFLLVIEFYHVRESIDTSWGREGERRTRWFQGQWTLEDLKESRQW